MLFDVGRASDTKLCRLLWNTNLVEIELSSLCLPSLASHTLLAKNKAEGSGDRAYNVSFHSPCIGGETYLMCTCFCEGFRL